MQTISAHMIAQNLIKYHFPFEEAFRAVIPICDQFVFCEGFSEDDTYQRLLALQQEYPDKVEIFRKEWLTPDYMVFSEMTNACIERCHCDWHWQIQADEIYHESQLSRIQKLTERNDIEFYVFGFLHFWSNSFDKVLKPGTGHGESRIRFAKRDTYPDMRSRKDAYTLGTFTKKGDGFRGKDVSDEIQIYHYSYTRRPDREKEKACYQLNKWHNMKDERYWGEKKLVYSELHPDSDCLPWTDSHPAVMANWINQQKEKTEK